jgi:hypothetical protein
MERKNINTVVKATCYKIRDQKKQVIAVIDTDGLKGTNQRLMHFTQYLYLLFTLVQLWHRTTLPLSFRWH